MFELVRYTFLVVLGLACLVAIFIAIAVTSTIVGRSSGLDPEQNYFTTYLIWGGAALATCLWLSNSFIVKVPRTIGAWFQKNKDHIAAYTVISMIFLVFVVA